MDFKSRFQIIKNTLKLRKVVRYVVSKKFTH